MRTLILALALCAALAPAAHAGEYPDKPDPGKPAPTRLEDVSARTGSAVLVGRRLVAQMGNKLGVVNVEARIHFDAATPRQKEYGALVTVHDIADFAHYKNCFIDFDEIDPLLKGLDTLAAVDHGLTPLFDYMGTYVTRGGLFIGLTSFLTDGPGDVVVACGDNRAYFPQTELPTLNRFLARTKDVLEQAKLGRKLP